MVKEDGEAAKPIETLESPNPDSPNSGGAGDSQIGERGPRVSDECEDDMSVTLAQLSSKRFGKKLKAAAAKQDAALTDEKMEDTIDSVTLRRSRRNRSDVDVDVDPGDEMIEEEEESEDDEESEFSVGDFVWGKVKSHPWWPGRVFDPSDASQQALKYKHEGRILVAYFGDATFAWCESSQLKPFVENFAEMSNQSTSKSFLNAVEEAVTEFGKLVELDMTCYCTPRTAELIAHHQIQASALNAGIKGGVNVNKGGIGIYSVDRFNPAAFLAHLRIVGSHASVANLLELATLKSWVSAVYRSKEGPLLLKFNEMQEAAEEEGFGAGVEDSARGPVEEPVQVVPGMPDAVVQAKRKERSVAEIVYGDEKGNNEDAAEGVKSDSKSVRNKRKVVDENQKTTGDQEESLGDESLAGKRKKKSEKGDEKKEGRRSSRMKLAKGSLTPVIVVGESDVAALEESEMSPRTRDRKKSKYLSPPYTNLEYYRQTALTSPRATVETSQTVESSQTVSAQLSGSTPVVKGSGETSKKKLSKEDGKANGSAPATPTRASSRKGKSVTSSNNVLSGIQSAARSGRLSKGDHSLNAVKGFLTSYRTSKYQNVSDCNPSEAENQSGEKGESALGSDQEVVNEETKSVKKSKTKRDKAELKSKVKQADSEKDGKTGGTLEAAEVTYTIRNLKGKSVEKEADENGFPNKDSTISALQKRKRLIKKRSLAWASDGGLRLVKQKLEGMATMVAEAGDGKMSSEMKSELESRLKDLLDEVKALPASPLASETRV